MFVFTFQQIADHLSTVDDPEDYGHSELDLECDPDDSWLAKIEYYFSEARHTTLAELADRGLVIDREAQTVSILNRDAMTLAFRLCNEIGAEYDATRDEYPTNWWELLDLGGDDDVDYNDGYLSSNFNVLNDMLPEDHRCRPDEATVDDTLYNLPPDVIEHRLKEYREQFYKDNPEALVTENLRLHIRPYLEAYLNGQEFYHRSPALLVYPEYMESYLTFDTDNPKKPGCHRFTAPRSDHGPWVFTSDVTDHTFTLRED